VSTTRAAIVWMNVGNCRAEEGRARFDMMTCVPLLPATLTDTQTSIYYAN
jgi:hypothetical protein